MENQHRYINGYRDLSQKEIGAMNDIKAMGNSIGNFLEALAKNPDVDTDPRMISLAKTNLQEGLMWAVRAVAQPTSF